jgi:crossover junction endodeoxyribonuclease RusA
MSGGNEMKPLVLKMPPSVNHMYINAKIRGRNIRILNKHANDWFTDSLRKIEEFRDEHSWVIINEKVILELYFYYPNARLRDSHNTLKILLDVLERGRIYTNDKFALPRVMDFQLDKGYPRVEIFFCKYK